MEEIAAVLSNEIRRRYFYSGSLGEEKKEEEKISLDADAKKESHSQG